MVYLLLAFRIPSIRSGITCRFLAGNSRKFRDSRFRVERRQTGYKRLVAREEIIAKLMKIREERKGEGKRNWQVAGGLNDATAMYFTVYLIRRNASRSKLTFPRSHWRRERSQRFPSRLEFYDLLPSRLFSFRAVPLVFCARARVSLVRAFLPSRSRMSSRAARSCSHPRGHSISQRR